MYSYKISTNISLYLYINIILGGQLYFLENLFSNIVFVVSGLHNPTVGADHESDFEIKSSLSASKVSWILHPHLLFFFVCVTEDWILYY